MNRHLLPLFAVLAIGCTKDPLRMPLLDDTGAIPDAWLDAWVIPDGRRVNDLGVDVQRADISYDACITQLEVCNAVDDNCDGQIDEGFDKQSDPRYCENCKGCMQLLKQNAYPGCANGSCVIQSCVQGYVDLDKKVDNGCEYACGSTGVEICDGEDNDCDGQVDEDLTPPAQAICKNLGPCANATLKCRGKDGWQCDYGPDVELQPCEKDGDCGPGNRCNGNKVCPGIVVVDEKLCDGLDGDCDGVADDPWANPALPSAIGKSCIADLTKSGVCQSTGVFACDASKAGVSCKVIQPGSAPSNELCNGLDDDCDGKVDESTDDAAGKGVVDAWVPIKRTVSGKSYDFSIYAYEASRPDANASTAGNLEHRSCSKKNALPWAQVTYAQASTACQQAGGRLCSGEEWLVACQGAAITLYPYGATYQPQACNGVDLAVGKARATGSLTSCEGGDAGVFDLSGNVREWTSQKTGTVGAKSVYVVRGGAYHTPALGLTCSFSMSQAVEDVVLPAIGFRCCK